IVSDANDLLGGAHDPRGPLHRSPAVRSSLAIPEEPRLIARTDLRDRLSGSCGFRGIPPTPHHSGRARTTQVEKGLRARPAPRSTGPWFRRRSVVVADR